MDLYIVIHFGVNMRILTDTETLSETSAEDGGSITRHNTPKIITIICHKVDAHVASNLRYLLKSNTKLKQHSN